MEFCISGVLSMQVHCCPATQYRQGSHSNWAVDRLKIKNKSTDGPLTVTTAIPTKQKQWKNDLELAGCELELVMPKPSLLMA